MSDAQDKLRDKIQKLFALAEANSNPHEASSALAKAHALMAEAGFDRLDITTAEISHLQVKSLFSVSQPKIFESMLLRGVARVFGCALIWNDRHSSFGHRDYFARITVIGPKQHLVNVEHFMVLLQRNMFKGRQTFVKSLPKGMPRKLQTIQADGWCVGYAKSVIEPLAALSQVVSKEAVDHYVTKNFGALGQKNVGERDLGAHGLALGAEAGASEKLHRPMTGESKLKISHG